MDFLDPKKQRAHIQRLFVGYVLMAIVIGLGTLILVFASKGWGIDSTGSLIQNGMLFLDAKPESATITINGKVSGSKTDARLVLPEGSYTVKLSRDGYRSWQQNVSLLGGMVEHLSYPLLLPEKLVTKDVQVYDGQPNIVSESPDRHWLFVQTVDPKSVTFDVYDLVSGSTVPTQISLPATLLTATEIVKPLTAVEWSSDNVHLLLRHEVNAGSEYLLLDRENPANSININRTLGFNPTTMSLRDKRPDSLYLFEATGGVVRQADLKAKTVSAPQLQNVIAFKTHGDNIIVFITAENAAAGKVQLRVLENDKTYTLRELVVSKDGSYSLDVARYDGSWYYVAGSNADNKVFIYKDPLDVLKHSSTTKVVVKSILTVSALQSVTFSSNARYLAVQGGQQFSVFDAETDRLHHYTVAEPIDVGAKTSWMDGFRLVYRSGNQAMLMDFDGTNNQKLLGVSGMNVFFDRDYLKLYTINLPAANGRVVLEKTDLKYNPTPAN